MVLVLFVSVGCLAQPRFPFLDFPQAVVLGESGRTSAYIEWSEGAPAGVLVRAVTPRIDIAASVEWPMRLDLEARVLLIREWMPLQAVGVAGFRRYGLLSALLLGPVHLDAGRFWGQEAETWCVIQLGLSDRAALFGGVAWRDNAPGLLAGLRYHPPGIRPWGVSLQWRDKRLRIGLGGSW